MEGDAPLAPPKLSKAAVSGLLCSLVGLVFFPLSLIGLGLAIAGLIKTRAGRARGRGIAILAMVLAPLTLLTAAAQLQEIRRGMEQSGPAFMTVEARRNLARLVKLVDAAQAKTGKLPPALPLTPSQVPCGTNPTPWPADAAPGWGTLGFSPSEPLRYSYEYAPDPDGKSFAVRARGDLNCDGKTSLFELRPGALRPRVEDELE